MKRAKIISLTKQFLSENNIQDNIFEIRIDPQDINTNQRIHCRRTIIFTNVALTQSSSIVQKIESIGIKVSAHKHYATISEFDGGGLIKPEDNSLENNWRGRLLRSEDVLKLTDIIEIERTILHSYLQLIITKHNGQYFTRRLFETAFYIPGNSAVGIDNYKSEIKSLINWIQRAVEYNTVAIDPDFDFLSLIIKDESSQYLHIDLFGNKKLPIKDIIKKIKNEGTDQTASWLNDEIENRWPK